MAGIEPMQEGGPWSPQIETVFFKVLLRLQIPVRMKGTRHQLAPIMTGQKIVDRAVACWVPDRLFISCFQVVNIQELSGACRFRELLEKSLLLFQRHIFSYSPAARFGFQRVDPTMLSDTLVNSPICGWVFPSSRSNTIWIRCRITGSVSRFSAFFRRSTWSLLHLTIRFPLANQSDGLTESHSRSYGEPLFGGKC